jgi:hypothetical protein
LTVRLLDIETLASPIVHASFHRDAVVILLNTSKEDIVETIGSFVEKRKGIRMVAPNKTMRCHPTCWVLIGWWLFSTTNGIAWNSNRLTPFFLSSFTTTTTQYKRSLVVTKLSEVSMDSVLLPSKKRPSKSLPSPWSIPQEENEDPLDQQDSYSVTQATPTLANDTMITTNFDMTPIAFGSAPDTVLPKAETQIPLFQLAIAGALATFIGDAIIHPMDSLKTIQQDHIGWSIPTAARELWNVHHGLAGFYHGFWEYAGADAISGAIKFGVWEIWKRQQFLQLQPNSAKNTIHPPFQTILLFVGAALAFGVSSLTLVPGELLKQQLQVGHYQSLPQAITSIYQTYGILGFYMGYSAVLWRDVPYTMLELGLYEICKQQQKNQSQPTTRNGPFSQEITAAVTTGAITAILTTPLDTIKTKMMVDEQFIDMSFLETWDRLWQDYGALGMFAGVLARVAWIVPFTAVYLPTYDALKRTLWNYHHSEINNNNNNNLRQ